MRIGARGAEEPKAITHEDLSAAVSHLSAAERLPLLEEATEEESRWTWLQLSHGELFIQAESDLLPLPPAHLSAVIARYASPLGILGEFRGVLRLKDGTLLAHMLYVPEFDVEPKDYLVWSQAGSEPRVELCARLAAPLLHLARAESRRRSAPSD